MRRPLPYSQLPSKRLDPVRDPEADRERRIDHAARSASMLRAVNDVRNARYRASILHDRMEALVQSACRYNPGVRFNADETACLGEIAFHIAYVTDPQNGRDAGILGRLATLWHEATGVERVQIIGVAFGIPGMLVALITLSLMVAGLL